MENKGRKKRGIRFYLLLILAVIGAALVTAGAVWAVTAVLEKRAIGKKMSPDAMVSYMNEKYNTVFTFKERAGTNIIQGIPRRQIIVTCNEFPKENISVSVDRTEDNQFIYRDNYVSYLKRDEVQAKLEEIVFEVYGNGSKVFFAFGKGVLPENFNAVTTLEEYVASRYASLCTWVFLSDDLDEKIKEINVENFRKALKQNNAMSNFKICYMSSDYNFSLVNNKNFSDIVYKKEMYKEFGHFALYGLAK